MASFFKIAEIRCDREKVDLLSVAVIIIYFNSSIFFISLNSPD